MTSCHPTIGFVTLESTNSYPTQLFLGANDAATQLGCTLVTFSMNEQLLYANGTSLHLYEHIEKFIDRQGLDGLLFWTAGILRDHEAAPRLIGPYHTLPTVSLGVELSGVPSVLMDNFGGMFDLVTHLITQCQRRNLAFITGTPTNRDAQLRLAAYRAALAQHGLPVVEEAIVPGAFRWDSRALGAQAVVELLDRRGLHPDAIVAASDDLAIGALEELQRRGIDVPAEISVTGFDDLPEAMLLYPPLTTVAQPAYTLAWRGVALLLQIIAGAATTTAISIPTTPVIRRSCGAEAAATTALPLSALHFELRYTDEQRLSGGEPLGDGARHYYRNLLEGQLMALSLHQSTEQTAHIRDALLTAFEQSILRADPTVLTQTLEQRLANLQQQERLYAWQQGLLAVVEDFAQRNQWTALSISASASTAVFCQLLDQQIRLFFAEAINRAMHYQHVVEQQQLSLLHMVSHGLLLANDPHQILTIFQEKLPQLGITLAYVATYDHFDPVTDQVCLLVAYEAQPPTAPLATNQLYSTAALASGDLISQGRQLKLVLIPLYSTNIEAGFVIFGFGPRSYQFYTQLASMLGYSLVSTSLFGEMQSYAAQLEEHVSLRTAELQQTNQQLQAEVAERKRVEAQLAVAYEQAVSSSQLKSEFLATMSHEIRTPMNGILGMTELLLYSELDEEQHSYATVVLEESEKLLRIINDILDFSKIEAGKVLLEVAPLAPHVELEKVIRLLTPQAQSKGVRLSHTIADNVPSLLHGDATRLHQIMMNLIGNGVKFTEQGAVTAILSCLPPPTADDAVAHCRLQLVVRDTGIGMSADHLKNLFQLFVQGDRSTTRRFGGTGLGLAITHRLVSLMGGQIEVESQVGVGTEFTVTIPFVV
jgi:signal transduction histidine kinase/DNA-binding LacI/PurR family transcriptional regulator